jgi:hypothetical protein
MSVPRRLYIRKQQQVERLLLSAEEARLEARRAFGDPYQLRAPHGGARGFAWLTDARSE